MKFGANFGRIPKVHPPAHCSGTELLSSRSPNLILPETAEPKSGSQKWTPLFVESLHVTRYSGPENGPIFRVRDQRFFRPRVPEF